MDGVGKTIRAVEEGIKQVLSGRHMMVPSGSFPGIGSAPGSTELLPEVLRDN